MATNINSQEIQINRSANKVVDFLSDLNNYASLMPKEVNMFEVEGDQATLHVDGLGKFQLVVSEKTADQIVLKPSGKLPFDFDIFAPSFSTMPWQSSLVNGSSELSSPSSRISLWKKRA